MRAWLPRCLELSAFAVVSDRTARSQARSSARWSGPSTLGRSKAYARIFDVLRRISLLTLVREREGAIQNFELYGENAAAMSQRFEELARGAARSTLREELGRDMSSGEMSLEPDFTLQRDGLVSLYRRAQAEIDNPKRLDLYTLDHALDQDHLLRRKLLVELTARLNEVD